MNSKTLPYLLLAPATIFLVVFFLWPFLQIAWLAFTVPQYQRDAAYFAPLADLRVPGGTDLAFALVPYHPERQEAGTTDAQIDLIDGHLGSRRWGVCTECGMARAGREEIPGLLDLHRTIVQGAAVSAR